MFSESLLKPDIFKSSKSLLSNLSIAKLRYRWRKWNAILVALTVVAVFTKHYTTTQKLLLFALFLFVQLFMPPRSFNSVRFHNELFPRVKTWKGIYSVTFYFSIVLQVTSCPGSKASLVHRRNLCQTLV